MRAFDMSDRSMGGTGSMFGFKRRSRDVIIPRGHASITMEQAIRESERDGVAAMSHLPISGDGSGSAAGFIPATRCVGTRAGLQRALGHERRGRCADAVNPVDPSSIPTVQDGSATARSDLGGGVSREVAGTAAKTDGVVPSPAYHGRHSVARRDDPDMVRARRIAEETQRLAEERRREREMDAAVDREMADVYRSVAEKNARKVQAAPQAAPSHSSSGARDIPVKPSTVDPTTDIGTGKGLTTMSPNILPLRATTDSTIPMRRIPTSGIRTRDGYTVVPALVAMRDGDTQTARIIPFGS